MLVFYSRNCLSRKAFCHRAVRFTIYVLAISLSISGTCGSLALAEGEPAEDFLKRLRAAGYYDTALAYLDRLDQYPGVDGSLKDAVSLEKAQTYIEAGVNARSATERDEFFVKAESSIADFLKKDSHPRAPEARLQLGKLQLVRANTLMMLDPDDDKKKAARESYLNAAKTFDTIVENLRTQLKEMQGEKINADENPKLAEQRTQYRADFLEAKLNAGDARRLAATTFANPAKDGKKLLDEAITQFKDLADNYGGYVTGAIAILHLGQTQQLLGQNDAALDSFLQFLEQPDADPLREGRFEATSALTQIWLAKSPPDYNPAIERGQGLLDTVRPNEKRLPAALHLKLELAKAYLAKSKDTKGQKKTDIKRAESAGRQLLIEIEKLPGTHAEESTKLLAEMGVDLTPTELPKADDPENLEEAFAASRELYQLSEDLRQALELLKQQKKDDAEHKKQIESLEKQLADTRYLAIETLRLGMTMINRGADLTTLNQAKHFYAVLLYQVDRFRDAAVVGDNLARTSPGTEVGLKGGLVALSALQKLLVEVPQDENTNLIAQLKSIGDFLTVTWPDDPEAAAAQGIMIRLALQKDQWDQAQSLVSKMPQGPERASFERLMGQLLWNQSIVARQEKNDALADKLLGDAEKELIKGLSGIKGGLIEPEGLRAALVLAKVYLRKGDDAKALATLDHKTYGPVKLISKIADDDDALRGDLFATELTTIVQRMTSDGTDPTALLKRATAVMDKLRQTYKGDDGQKRLQSIYIGMARSLKDELETANAAKKDKLIDAFRVFLTQIAETTKDPATLQWIVQTLVQLGEAAMPEAETKATGRAKELLATAIKTYEQLKAQNPDVSLSVQFQLARAYRLVGQYKNSLDVLEQILLEKPTMLDAQVEAATAYETWAGELPDKFAPKAYQTALNGGRPGPNKQNTIWGWGKISKLTNGNEQFKEIFFDARYHIALSRFLWGRRAKDTSIMKRAITDITQVAGIYPELGSPAQRAKFDALLRQIQKEVGDPVKGLPPLPPAG
ncbi:hypothetical protein [Novipirellula rosea]|uniref:tetratricopeptide repeat protein n=1 Tax=Novipirellula rosea TaxID=1031540 RepID=UPI0031E53C8F